MSRNMSFAIGWAFGGAVIAALFIGGVISVTPDCPEPVVDTVTDTLVYWERASDRLYYWQDQSMIARRAHDDCADSIAVLNEQIELRRLMQPLVIFNRDTVEYLSDLWLYGSHGPLPDRAISQQDIDSTAAAMRALYCAGTVSIAAVDSFIQSHMNLYACGNDSLSWYACVTGHDLSQFLEQARGL